MTFFGLGNILTVGDCRMIKNNPEKKKVEWKSNRSINKNQEFDEEFAADFIPFYTDPLTGNQIFIDKKNIKDDDFDF